MAVTAGFTASDARRVPGPHTDSRPIARADTLMPVLLGFLRPPSRYNHTAADWFTTEISRALLRVLLGTRCAGCVLGLLNAKLPRGRVAAVRRSQEPPPYGGLDRCTLRAWSTHVPVAFTSIQDAHPALHTGLVLTSFAATFRT